MDSAAAPSPELLASLSEYFSEQELGALLSKAPEDYQPLAFADPVEMFTLIYPEVFTAADLAFNSWQIETNIFIARGGAFSKKNPLEISIAAANGSGKDSYLIAPLSIFLASCKIRQRVIITSASYTQLKIQTEANIVNLALAVNKFYRLTLKEEEPFLVKKGHILNTATGSEIVMFVTDEVGRAEGYHPWNHPESAVTIILNEAKTVPDEIFDSLSRCTYSRWIEVSSPGRTGGKFHKHSTSARGWLEGYESGKRIFRRITSYDCPHISRSKIESDKYEMGENSPLFRSKHLALFTSIEENVVIPSELIERAARRDNGCEDIELEATCGIDLAAGGDETSLYCYKGNVKVHELHWRESDTTKTVAKILEELRMLESAHKLKDYNVCMDDGGIGQGMIDNIVKAGWCVTRVKNQSTAYNNVQFGNRGAEIWFNGRRLFEDNLVKLDADKDKKLIEQLTSRYYKQSEALGKFVLESKKEARANGHGSPDRADAWVLCHSKNTVRKFREKGKVAVDTTKSRYISQEELIKEMDRMKFEHLLGGIGKDKPTQSSVSAKQGGKTHPSNILLALYDNEEHS